MTTAEIASQLSLGEGQNLEFKTGGVEVESIGPVVCGFLNTSGGCLVCGIDGEGDVAGMDGSPEDVARIERDLYEGLSPKALVSIHAQAIDGKNVIVFEVPLGKDVPYAFRDVIYLRDSGGTRRADAETIRDIVMRRQIEPERWERRFSRADLEADVDVREVFAAVTDAQVVRRAYFRDASQPLMVLEDFSAAKYGRLTNGGDVLFARNPAIRLPQTRVRAVRYNSDKAGDEFSDMKSFEGPLHAVFEEAFSFIVRNTPSVSRFIKGNPKRQDAPLYPEDAVREALINALAHRDYASASGGVSIHVFPRSLEIWNSGPLPEGVTTENLPKGHISVLRNPDIAHTLYLRGLMEKLGRGSVLMVEQCRHSGLPDPTWTSDPDQGVTVTFRSMEATAEETPKIESPQPNDVVHENVERGIRASVAAFQKALFTMKNQQVRAKVANLFGITRLDSPESLDRAIHSVLENPERDDLFSRAMGSLRALHELLPESSKDDRRAIVQLQKLLTSRVFPIDRIRDAVEGVMTNKGVVTGAGATCIAPEYLTHLAAGLKPEFDYSGLMHQVNAPIGNSSPLALIYAVLLDLASQAGFLAESDSVEVVTEGRMLALGRKLRGWVIARANQIFIRIQSPEDNSPLASPLCYCVVSKLKEPERRRQLHALIEKIVGVIPELVFFELDPDADPDGAEHLALQYIGGPSGPPTPGF